MSTTGLLVMPRFAGVRAAFVFGATAVAAIAATLFWGISMGSWSAAPVNLLAAFILLALAWGCFHLKKWAWWIGVLLSGIYTVSFLISLPGITASIREQSSNGTSGFFYMAFTMGMLMVLTFAFLISLPSREAFGITKSAGGTTE